MAKLVALSGAIAGREFRVGELCIIGRSPNAHVRLPDLAVSRHHAKVTRVGDGFIIEDLESGCGTLVNGHYVTVSHLRPGNEVRICEFSFRFEDLRPDRMPTAEYELVCDDRHARIVTVDASRFTQMQPVQGSGDAATISKLTRRLNAVLAVGQAASRNPESRALLEEIMGYCLETFPAAGRAMVATPDRARESLVVQALARRMDAPEAAFVLSRNVMSEVLYRGRSVVADVEGQLTGDDAAAESVGSIMVAPLICQGQMLGLMYVDLLAGAAPLTTEDLELLAGMAAHVALALHAAQLRETIDARSRTAQELSAAHEVQKRFLPRGVPKMASFTFVAHYDPSHDVGGDLYDFIPLDAGHLGVVIGDVSGKGFPAALVMAWVASQLRVAAHQERDPAAVISRVNQALLEAHQDDLFVTLLYGILDRWTMSFRFCNAGHVSPVVRRERDGHVEVIDDGIGLPIGVVADASYEERRVVLEQGDIVLLVTDGVTEAMSDAGEMYGVGGLFAAAGYAGSPATALVSHVLGDMRRFVNGATQYDDITIVALGAEGTTEDVMSTLPPGALQSDFIKR